MIKKILVANRGEIAMRIFRTCRVMNISTVAVYTHVDRGALHVRYAEEAYCISESPEDTSYLKPELILFFTSIILSQLSQSLTKTPELQQLLRDIPLLYRAVMHLAFSVTAGLP